MNTVCGFEGGRDVDNSVTRDKGGGTKLFVERTDFPANLIHRKIYIYCRLNDLIILKSI